MQELGEAMEFGIFDFSKVFSRAFGEEGNGGSGDLEWKPRGGLVTTSPPSESNFFASHLLYFCSLHLYLKNKKE